MPGSKRLVGASPAFLQLLHNIEKVAGCSASVLLLGESGTGKEVVAEHIHALSPRATQPLVTLECAGLSDTLFESELFGHVRGAFTGAHSNKTGLAAMANGGTLFLDEIGDIPLPMQVKLLRLLETGRFRPVGSTQQQQTDFRLLCATHLDLHQRVLDGRFRQDLFYRINVFPLRIPPLRERMSDLPQLALALVSQMKTRRPMTFTEDAFTALMSHPFPGNIRELRNILARAVVLSSSNQIDRDLISRAFCIDETFGPQTQAAAQSEPSVEAQLGNRESPVAQPLPVATPASLVADLVRALVTINADLRVQTLETGYIEALMTQFNGDKQRVASAAGISLRSLYRKLDSAKTGGNNSNTAEAISSPLT